MKRALIIGGGFAGCCAAHMLHQIGWHATIIERGPELGAGVRTKWYGGHPYTFGPRHFLTQSSEVFAYMDQIVPLRSCADHEFWTYVEGDEAFYNFPIHIDDIERMPDENQINAELDLVQLSVGFVPENLEEYWIASVGETLYRKMIDGYSRKMWRIADNKSLDTFNWSPKGVAIKSGPRAAWDSAMSAYPYAATGYNHYFDVATAEATVRLNTEILAINMERRRVWIGGKSEIFDLIINTASPDDIMGGQYGNLRYIGRDFHKLVLPIARAFPPHVYFLYYAGSEEFTRLVEYKAFTHHEAPTTLIGIEVPSMNGRHYPMPTKSEQAKAALYHAAMPKGVYSIGRLGSYRYGLDIAGCIEQVFSMIEEIKQGGQEHAVPGSKWR